MGDPICLSFAFNRKRSIAWKNLVPGLHWIMEGGTPVLAFQNNEGTTTLGFQTNLNQLQGSRVNRALFPTKYFLFWKLLRPGVRRWRGMHPPSPQGWEMLQDSVCPVRCPPCIRDQRIWHTGPRLDGRGQWRGSLVWGGRGSVRTALVSGVTDTQNNSTVPGPQEKLSLALLKGAKILTAYNFDVSDI